FIDRRNRNMTLDRVFATIAGRNLHRVATGHFVRAQLLFDRTHIAGIDGFNLKAIRVEVFDIFLAAAAIWILV
ncbi:MAG: hypothetical protein RLZZ110_1451, partial [Bacteroidota bacterium]